MYIYIYIYVYIHTTNSSGVGWGEDEVPWGTIKYWSVRNSWGAPGRFGKGQMGSELMGSLRISCFSTGYSR